MTKINYSEDYVKGAIQSNGVDIKEVTHHQLSAYRAGLRQIEADLMIEQSFAKHKTSIEDFDVSIFKRSERP